MVNNLYCVFALILRDQRGKAAFAYSRSIVKGNWWRVFFFLFLGVFIVFGLQIILSKLLNTVPFMNDFWVSLLSQTLPQFIAIGISSGSILLFLNLDYHKSSGDHPSMILAKNNVSIYKSEIQLYRDYRDRHGSIPFWTKHHRK